MKLLWTIHPPLKLGIRLPSYRRINNEIRLQGPGSLSTNWKRHKTATRFSSTNQKKPKTVAEPSSTYKIHNNSTVLRTIWSWCCLKGAHNWIGGTIGGRENGMGREWRGGGQFTSNLGTGWTRIAPRKEEGFQVSRRDSGERGIVKGNQQGELAMGINKGLCHGLGSSICIDVSWYCVNVANKRIVFRL